ncbi:AraC family transcriptional regulator [Pseudonocardia sp. HH130630-07]|uniref:AraC family transcriptional regulator n=1 Tax=Pseudonocardia sp. HH130630-07 TaxID=1690815 RepID=UPI000814C2BC|nr:AraC family transcriptional regulator [Pseudonocardia sp. HH130630-07]ANY05152.1 DNA-binding protein [Pseudonocardia sp. HH130630-07]
MPDDQLSQALDLVEVRGVLSDGFALRGRWEMREPLQESTKLIASVTGRVELTTDGLGPPLHLGPGDVAVLNERSWLRLRGGTGTGPRVTITDGLGSRFLLSAGAERAGAGNVLIGGRIDLDDAGRALLLPALPPAGVVRASAPTAATLRHELDRVVDELTAGRMGSAFAIRQRGHLLALEVLRTYAEQARLPSGWLRLLTDPGLRPAVSRMHAEPGRAWGLDELAAAAAMSRTTFADRFRAAAGMPPLAYLARWRMLLARRALRDRDTGIRALASTLGYASESAFSTAFKRVVGEAPAHYRDRVRAAPAHPDPRS